MLYYYCYYFTIINFLCIALFEYYYILFYMYALAYIFYIYSIFLFYIYSIFVFYIYSTYMLWQLFLIIIVTFYILQGCNKYLGIYHWLVKFQKDFWYVRN